jgi:hypothetical protein
MSTINAAGYGFIRDYLYRDGFGKEELKAHASLPTDAKFWAAFQVLEDVWETNKASLKSQVDTALGFTTTATEAKKILAAWLSWKIKQ